MWAVWTRARSDLRRHMREAIVLAVLIGLTSALALAAAEGAHRTGTAYARLRAVTGAPDSIVFSGRGVAESIAPHVDLSKVARLPQVEALHTLTFMMGESLGADGKPLLAQSLNADANVVGAHTVAGQSLMPWKVLQGRLPDPSRSDEVVVGYTTLNDPRAAVGSTIALRLVKGGVTAEDLAGAMGSRDPTTILGPPIQLKVVGKVVVLDGNNELSGGNQDFFVTPAFVQRYLPSTISADLGMVTLKGGTSDVPAFEKAVFALTPNAIVSSSAEEAATVKRSVSVRVVTLWLFALLTTVVGLMIFGQALSRLDFVEARENPILSALGMTRRQLVAVSMVRASLIGVAAAAVTLIAAVAASGLFPTGLARVVEPAPGIHVPASAVAGAALVVLGVLLLSVPPALRSARTRGDAQDLAAMAESGRPSAIAAFVARSGLPASAAAGVRLALEPGRGRTAVPVRSAMVGFTLAVLALTAAMGFSASFKHLVETPRLWGTYMDFGGGYPFGGGFEKAIAAMVADPGLSGVTVGNYHDAVDVQGPKGSVAVNAWGMDTVKGALTPTMAKGSWPADVGEVALGGKTMRQVGARIGDTVRVRAGTTSLPLRVVGQPVFGAFGFGPGLAEGAGMSFTQLRAFYPKEARNLFLANLAPGASAAAVSARLDPLFRPHGATLTAAAADPGFSSSGVVAQLGSAQWVPLALSGLLAVAAVGTLAHTIVTSVRRRRRDLAVLKTLGFVRRQISATVAWQATTFAGIALAIGLPLGVALGRWGWTIFANAVGVLAVPVVDVRLVLVVIPATLLLANLIALVPGRLAAATRPAAVFRAE